MSEIIYSDGLNAATIQGEVSGAEISGELLGTGIIGDAIVGGVTIVHTPDIPPATTSTIGGIIVGNDLLITDDGRLYVDKADSAEEDNTRPITAAAVYTEIGNINALLATI